jgi:hypothetical protein
VGVTIFICHRTERVRAPEGAQSVVISLHGSTSYLNATVFSESLPPRFWHIHYNNLRKRKRSICVTSIVCCCEVEATEDAVLVCSGEPQEHTRVYVLTQSTDWCTVFYSDITNPFIIIFSNRVYPICSYLKFLYQVFTVNNLIRNNYFKFYYYYYYYYWYQILGGNCCHFQDRPKDGDATFIRNVGIYLPNYMASVFKLIKNSV